VEQEGLGAKKLVSRGVMQQPYFLKMGVLLLLVSLIVVGCRQETDVTPTRTVPGGDPERGQRLVQDHGCTACHIIPGVRRPDSLVGPPLENWSQRRLIAGRFPNQPDYLIEWIMTPQAMIPGSGMPDLGVPESDARDIAAYLYTIE
jgi:cytochrome c